MRLGRFAAGTEAHKAFLWHFDLHLLDFSELSIGDELLEFADHRVTGVVVRGAEKSFCLGNNFCNGFAFGYACGERLFTNDGVTCSEGFDDDVFVVVCRCEHYDGIEFAFFGLQ